MFPQLQAPLLLSKSSLCMLSSSIYYRTPALLAFVLVILICHAFSPSFKHIQILLALLYIVSQNMDDTIFSSIQTEKKI